MSNKRRVKALEYVNEISYNIDLDSIANRNVTKLNRSVLDTVVSTYTAIETIQYLRSNKIPLALKNCKAIKFNKINVSFIFKLLWVSKSDQRSK